MTLHNSRLQSGASTIEYLLYALLFLVVAGIVAVVGFVVIRNQSDEYIYGADLLAMCDSPAQTQVGSLQPNTRLLPLDWQQHAVDKELAGLLPPQYRSASRADVGAVVCTVNTTQNAENVAYVGIGATNRGQVVTGCVREVSVTDTYIIDIKSRQTIYYTRLVGGIPGDCADILKGQERKIGPPVTKQQIVDWVKQQMSFASAASVSGTSTGGPTAVAMSAAGSETTPALKFVLKGHKGAVTGVAFSPDQSLLASASADNSIRLWNVSTGQEVGVLKGATDQVLSLAFSPDGTKLVTGGKDKSVRIWDVATKKITNEYKGHTDAVTSVLYSPDQKRIVSASADKTIRVWLAGKVEGILRGHTDQVLALAFNSDGSTLASAGADKTIRLWNIKEGKPGPVLKGHTDTITSIAFAGNDAMLGSASKDGTVRLWTVTNGLEVAKLTSHSDVVTSIAYSPDGRYIASGSRDTTVQVWDARTGQQLTVIKPDSDAIVSLAFSPDSLLLALGTANNTVQLWSIPTFIE